MVQKSIRRVVLITFLPFLHISACLIVELAKLESGWMYVSIADFPASVIAMAVRYNWDHPIALFGTIGTLVVAYPQCRSSTLVRQNFSCTTEFQPEPRARRSRDSRQDAGATPTTAVRNCREL